jgi:hypothetical protein
MCVLCKPFRTSTESPYLELWSSRTFHLMIQVPSTVEFSNITHGHRLKSLTNMQDCCKATLGGPPCYQEKGWESDEMLVPRGFTEWKWESTVNCQIFHLSLPTVIDWRGIRKLSRKHWLCSTRWVTHAAISEMKFTNWLTWFTVLFYFPSTQKNYVKSAFGLTFLFSTRFSCMECGVTHCMPSSR